jgi:hypothetical protein
LLLRQGTGATQTDAFTLQGAFVVAVAPGLMTLSASAFVQVLGLGSLATTGAFQFTSAGAAGFVTLGATLGNTNAVTRTGSGYSFDGRFRIEFNTTNALVNNVGGSGQNLAAGTFVRIVISGTNLTDPATLTLGAVRMSALFTLEAGTATVGTLPAAVLAITATNATLSVVAGSTTLFSMSADGALLLSSIGIAAKITLGASAESGPGYAFSGSFTLEANTMNAAIPTIITKTKSRSCPYVRIRVAGPGGTGNATLTVAGVNLVGTFTLTAGNQTINGTSQVALSLDATATLQLRAGGVRVFDLSVDGALLVFSGGTAVRLTVTQSTGGAPDTTLGFTVDSGMTFTFEAYTAASGSVTIPGTTGGAINAGLRVIATGNLNALGFTLTGAFSFAVGTITTGGTTQTGMLVTVGTATTPVTTTLGVGSTTFFTFTASGALQISSFGFAARLTLTSAAGASSVTFGQNATANGFSTTATFFFEANTTNRTTAITGIESGVFVRFGGTGTLAFRLAGADVFVATATLQFADSGSNLSLRIAGTVAVGFLGSFTVDRTLTLSVGGLAGVLELNTGASVALAGTRFDFNGRIQLQINTTSAALNRPSLVNIGSTAANPPVTVQNISVAGNTVSLLIAGRLQLQQGSGSGTDAFFADGNFVLTKSGANYSMSGDVRVDLSFLGRMIGTFGLTISSAGMAGVVRLAAGANTTLTGGAGFDVSGYFSLEFNTTSAAVPIVNGRVQVNDSHVVVLSGSVPLLENVTIDPFTVQLFVAGEIQLFQGSAQTDSFRLFGGISFAISTTGLHVVGDVALSVPRLTDLAGSVDFQMSAAGIVASITVGGSGQTTIDRTGFEVNARFRLEVNTTAGGGPIQRIRTDSATGAVVLSNGSPVFDTTGQFRHTVRLFCGRQHHL